MPGHAEVESSAMLGEEILRSVSRSFYLSIRLLPHALREPVSLGYLLARATDTIADSGHVEPAARVEALRVLAAVIQGEESATRLPGIRARFAAAQQDPGERRLVEALPECVDWLDGIAEADRADIRTVLREITKGQALDLVRFQTGGEIRSLATAAELDEYTYLVAGCVGEFWTRLGFRHLHDFAALNQEAMRDLGVAYGKGLQLVNVLRDLGDDLRQGRCYLPADELAEGGLRAADLLSNPTRAEPVVQRWLARARAGIEAGIDYACAIRSRRVRLATALPALIGARTLALLNQSSGDRFSTRVKMPRNEVRTVVLATTARFASRRFLRQEVRRLSA